MNKEQEASFEFTANAAIALTEFSAEQARKATEESIAALHALHEQEVAQALTGIQEQVFKAAKDRRYIADQLISNTKEVQELLIAKLKEKGFQTHLRLEKSGNAKLHTLFIYWGKNTKWKVDILTPDERTNQELDEFYHSGR